MTNLFVLVVGSIACILASTIAAEQLLSAKVSIAVLGLLIPIGCALYGIVCVASRHWTSYEKEPPRIMAASMTAHVACGVMLFMSYYFGAAAQKAGIVGAAFVAAKAAKMVPTMIVGVFWLHKHFSKVDWFASALTVCGLALLMFDSPTPPQADDRAQSVANDHDSVILDGLAFGTGSLLASLLFDGLSSNLQEAMMAQYGCDATEIAAFSMGTASALFSGSIALNADAYQSFKHLFAYGNWTTLQWAGVYGLANVGATVVALRMVESFGAAATGFTTAVCKGISIIILLASSSALPSLMQAGGIVLLLGAIGLAGVSKVPSPSPGEAPSSPASSTSSSSSPPLSSSDADRRLSHRKHTMQEQCAPTPKHARRRERCSYHTPAASGFATDSGHAAAPAAGSSLSLRHKPPTSSPLASPARPAARGGTAPASRHGAPEQAVPLSAHRVNVAQERRPQPGKTTRRGRVFNFESSSTGSGAALHGGRQGSSPLGSSSSGSPSTSQDGWRSSGDNANVDSRPPSKSSMQGGLASTSSAGSNTHVSVSGPSEFSPTKQLIVATEPATPVRHRPVQSAFQRVTGVAVPASPSFDSVSPLIATPPSTRARLVARPSADTAFSSR